MDGEKQNCLQLENVKALFFFIAGALFFQSMSLCLIVVFAHNIFRQSELQCAQLC